MPVQETATPASRNAHQEPQQSSGWLSRLTQEQIVFAVAILLALVFAATLPGFATVGNAVSLLNSISVVGILALGAAVVIIARGLDISQIGSMVAGASLAAVLMGHGWTVSWALFCGLLLSTAIGLLNGFIIAFVEVPPLFATLAMNLLIFGLVRLLIVGGVYTVFVPNDAHAFLALGGKIAGIPISVLVFFGMALLIHLFLSRTRLGRFIYAHGDNPEAARQAGIPVRPLTIFEYVLAADVGYIAGLMLMATLSSIDTQMISGSMIFNVILVAVLGGVSLVGGRGSVFCVLAGALLIGVVLNGMTLLNLNDDLQNIVRGLVLLGAIVLDNRLHPRDEETARQGE